MPANGARREIAESIVQRAKRGIFGEPYPTTSGIALVPLVAKIADDLVGGPAEVERRRR